MISKPTYQIIDDIISRFDFEFVRAYMIVNKWTWWGKQVPTIKDLKCTATSLLIEIIEGTKKDDSRSTFCGTGGLKASYFKHSNQFYLEFVIQKKYTGAN